MTPAVRLKRGFTLIEILVVITIIGILSTLLIVGISHLRTSANRQQTHAVLQNCQSWWNEFDASQHYHFDQFEIDAPGNVSADMETQAEATGVFGGDRIGTAVYFTRCLFELMRTVPNIKSSMEHFPCNRAMLPVPKNGPAYYIGAVAQWAPGFTWPAGKTYCYVTYTDPLNGQSTLSYMASTTHLSSDGSVAPSNGAAPLPYNGPPNPGCWFPLLYSPQEPVLLDAWGNPVIAVLGGILGNGPVGTGGGLPNTTTGYVTAGGLHVQVTSPDKRLYFASAGPDNDFSKGDDNLYSFDFK